MVRMRFVLPVVVPPPPPPPVVCGSPLQEASETTAAIAKAKNRVRFI